MRKIISIILTSTIIILVAILIFLTTAGIKTDNFNNLINEKVNEIDPKIKLKLNQVNFKFIFGSISLTFSFIKLLKLSVLIPTVVRNIKIAIKMVIIDIIIIEVILRI